MSARKRSKSDVYELVSRNIKKYRKEAKLTQAQLAELSDLSHEFIRRIEAPNINNHFSLSTVSIIADALEIDIKNLFDEIEDK